MPGDQRCTIHVSRLMVECRLRTRRSPRRCGSAKSSRYRSASASPRYYGFALLKFRCCFRCLRCSKSSRSSRLRRRTLRASRFVLRAFAACTNLDRCPKYSAGYSHTQAAAGLPSQALDPRLHAGSLACSHELKRADVDRVALQINAAVEFKKFDKFASEDSIFDIPRQFRERG